MARYMTTVTAMKKRRRNNGERKPVYDPNPTKRIISVPNGMWQVQVRIAENGQREWCNWMNVHSPQEDKAIAERMCYNRCVVAPENISV